MKKYELKEFVRKYILIPIMVLFLSLSSINSEALVLIAQDDEMPVEEIQETITEVKEEVEEVVTEEEPMVEEIEETPMPEETPLPEVIEETPMPEVTEEPVMEETPVPTEEPTPEPTIEPTIEPTVEPTPEVVEEVTETPEPTEVPEVIEEVTYPAFKQEKTIDNITITVEAPEDVFPEGATLSVEQVPVYVEKQVTEAIDQVREEEKNVAVSYTFDIKVLDKEGNEIQPKDMNKVKVSFKMVEVQNENLSTDVYHIDDKQEEITSEQVTPLESTTEEDVATVETDGFSLYTVEFTYNNKQYVLEGDTYVKLEEVLSFVELTGEVTSWEVSNPELFNIYLGDEDGIEYIENYDDNGDLVEYYPINKEDGNILYMVALQPFTTEEWLKVTIDGIEYTIVVTDAIRVDENGDQINTSVRYISSTSSASSLTTGTNSAITDSRVIQGPTEENFTASMPLAEIYIDDTIVNQTLWRQDQYNGTRVIAELLVDNTQGKYKGFKINADPEVAAGNNMASSYGALYYSFSERYLNDTQTLTVSGSSANNYEKFSGDIVRYTLKGMATKFDPVANEYKNYDVVITYSDLLITLAQNSGTGSVNQANISDKLMLIDTNMVNFKWTGGFRAGLEYSVNVKVVDPDTGALIDGSYYYPMVDIDVGRNGIGGFANLYNAANVSRYSEQIALLSNYGRPTSSGSWEQKVWIPGGNWSQTPVTNLSNITDEAFPYACKISGKTIDGQANTMVIEPSRANGGMIGAIAGAKGQNPDPHDNSFYSGFITLANNTAGGINVKGWASAPTSGGVESYVLTGSQIVNHKVDASSDVGGTIFTTTTGNSDGSLSGGTLLGYNEINKPFEISAATGQSVTYTMTPKGGYKLKRVWVKDGDIDIMTIVNTAKATIDPSQYDMDDETQKAAYEADVQAAINTALSNDPDTSEISISSLTSLGKGVYTYTFQGIQENKSIHIDWEKTDLTVTKELNPTMSGITDKFKFQIKLSDTSTEETTWRVRAKKNTGNLIYNQNVENESPYYMSYHEGHTETLPYAYVQVLDTTDKNPYEEGWYYYQDGAYYPSYDTTVNPSINYYERDDTQTSTTTNYYHHILGWNETTQTWDEHVLSAPNNETTSVSLGLDNLDLELSDAYRFVSDGTYVYNQASYDSATDEYTEYLMWIQDDTINEEVLVLGNSETYPLGRPFVPDNISWASRYIYVFRDGVADYSDKVIHSGSMYKNIGGESYLHINSANKYEYAEDPTSPVYYNLITNPNGYTLDSGYTEVEGESGMYLITLPAGQNPNTTDLVNDGWDVTVSRVGAIEDDFDLDKAMADAGAKSVAGAVNTYEFELGVDETIDFNGVIPMGWNYEITEVLPDNSRWRLLSSSSNATINDFDGEEDVTFTNTEKTYNVTIEKQTVDNQPGAFGFTIEIYKENITRGQNQNISIQAYKNSEDTNVTYKLTNTGNPIDIDMNGVSTTIPTGDSYLSDGGPIGTLIGDLITLDNTTPNSIVMNGLAGEITAGASKSIYDEVQEVINEGNNSFSLEPISFELRTPDIIDRVPYNPTTVPTGFTGSNGVFTCTLTYPSDAQKVFTDIPQGYKYEIRETTIPVGWKNVSKSNETGTLTNDVTSVWVNGQADYTLTVNKETVNNDTGSFTFKVKLWAETTATYMDLSADFGSPDSNGYYTFTLANGGTRQIVDIPTGYQYEVFEVDTSGNEVPVGSNIGTTDWKLKSITGNNTGTLTEDSEVTFTNELTHELTIKKETVNNVEGTFNYEVIIYGLENIFTADMGEGSDSSRPLSNQVFKYVPGLEFANTVQYNDDPTYCVYEYYDDTEGREYLSNNGSMAYSSDSFELHGGDQQWYVDPNQISADSDDLWPEALSADVLTLKALRFYNIEADSYDYKVSYDTDKFNVNYLGYVNKFTLANGESKTISNIPHGYKYEVYEVDSEGNKVLVGGNIGTTDWKLKSIDGENSGTLSEDKEVTFTNELTHELTIKKETVNNDSGTFNFVLVVYGETQFFKADIERHSWSYISNGNLENYSCSFENPELTYIPGLEFINNRQGDGYPHYRVAEYFDGISGFVWSGGDGGGQYNTNGFYFVESSVDEFTPNGLHSNGGALQRPESIKDTYTFVAKAFNSYDIDTQSYTYEIYESKYDPYADNKFFSNDLGFEAHLNEFTLNNGESITIPNIPHGYNYEVYEVDSQGNKVLVGSNIGSTDWRLKSIDGNNIGTITDDAEVTFTNELVHDLTITKQTIDDIEGTFNFKIKMWNETQDTSNYTYTPMSIVPVGDGDCDQTWSLEPEITFEYKGKTFEQGQEYVLCKATYSEPYSGGWSNAKWYVGPMTYDPSNRDYDVDPILASFFEAIEATPTENTPYDPFNDSNREALHNTGERVIVNGEEYPLFASGYNGIGSEGWYSVCFGETPLTYSYIDVSEYGNTTESSNNEYIFSLHNGESLTLSDLPHGVKYEVYEETQDGWKLVDINGNQPTVSTGAGGTSGTLNEDTEEIFNNTPLYDIEVNKTVTGLKGDKNKEFEFTVKVYSDPPEMSGGFADNYIIYQTYPLGDLPTFYYDLYHDECSPPNYAYYWATDNSSPLYNYIYNLPGGPEVLPYNGIIDLQFTHTINGTEYPIYIDLTDLPRTYLSTYYLDLTSFGGTSNGDGTYTFKLKHGQHFTLEDIPYGYKYEVVEKDYSSEQYTTTVDGIETRTVNGTVTEDKTHEYINDKNFADLTIKKIVSGNMGDKYKEYEFEVKVSGWKTILKDKISNYFSNNDGAYMDLSEDHADDIIAIGGILPKYASKFRMLANGNICIEAGSDDFDALTYNEADGTITGYMMDISSNRIDFHEGSSGQSIYPKPQAGDIIELQYFEEMDLREYGGVAKVDDNHDGIADDGVYIFKLKHNGIINIPNIPGGYQYEVVENDYSGIGYITTVDGQLGREVKKTLTEDAEHEFENHLNAVIPTKAFGGLLTPMLGMMLIAIVWLVMKRTVWKDEFDE